MHYAPHPDLRQGRPRTPHSALRTPHCSLFPAPCSLLPAPCSLLPAPQHATILFLLKSITEGPSPHPPTLGASLSSGFRPMIHFPDLCCINIPLMMISPLGTKMSSSAYTVMVSDWMLTVQVV